MPSMHRCAHGFLLTLAVLLFADGALAQGPYQLTGEVTNQAGAPLEGSTVDVLTPGTTTIVATDTTDAAGLYSLTIPAGTYDVRVTPAVGGFQSAIALNQVISGNTTLDFVLVPPGAATLSGRVLDGLGNGISGAYVTLNPVGGAGQPPVLSGSGGSYEFSVSPGNYYLYISGYSLGGATSRNFETYPQSALALNESTVVDVTLPFKRVSIHVQDPAGSPASNVSLSVGGIYSPGIVVGSATSYGFSGYPTGDPVVTDAAGNATLWLFPAEGTYGSYTFTAVPPAGSGFATTSLQNVTFTGDTSVTVQLTTPVTLSGRVLDGLGSGISGAYVTLNPVGGAGQPPVLSGSGGSYEFNVSPGNYYLYISGYGLGGATSRNFETYPQSALALSENTVVDVTLPFKRVSVHVQDPAGSPASNVSLSVGGIYSPGIVVGSATSYGFSGYPTGDPVVTDAAGDATLWLFPAEGTYGSYTFTAAPPAGSGFATTSLQNVTFTGDTSVTVQLTTPVTLSGRVLDGLGSGISGAYVTLNPVGGAGQPPVLSGSGGSYEFNVSPGNYYLYISGYSLGGATSRNFETYPQSALALSESTVVDVTLPFKRVSVHVQDPAGSPVSNVSLSAGGIYSPGIVVGSATSYGFSGYPTGDPVPTDAVGNATLWLFPADGTYGSYTLTAVPPAGTPFSTFNVQNVLVTSDKSIVVVLQFEHAPPITTMSLSPAPDAAGLYPDPVTVTLSATAAAGFAIQATYYKVDNGPTQTYTGPFQVSGDGSHTLQYWSVDDGGVFELPNTTTFEIQSVAIVGTSPGHAWVGLKNSDDQGTWFDIRAELYVNGVQVSEGLTRCVTGITRNPSLAKDVAVPFGPVTGGDLSSGDVVSVKFSTRIGTKPDGTKCGGHNNAVGLRLYFDAVSRPSRAGLHISPDPLTDNFLRSPGSGLYLDLAAPTGATPKQQDSGPINFAGGNPWAAIGTWSRVMP